MPLTKEEKKQREQQRTKEREKRFAQFPSVNVVFHDVNGNGGYAKLDPDMPFTLELAMHGEWRADAWDEDKYWKNFSIPLSDVRGLARFIHALVCRYNALAEEANGTAHSIKLTPLELIDDDSRIHKQHSAPDSRA